jgi:hypothetical protein
VLDFADQILKVRQERELTQAAVLSLTHFQALVFTWRCTPVCLFYLVVRFHFHRIGIALKNVLTDATHMQYPLGFHPVQECFLYDTKTPAHRICRLEAGVNGLRRYDERARWSPPPGRL